MPEVGTQLGSYFDETVERVTEEDVRIRATTERGVPVPGSRFRPRPLAAGAIGFGLAMTLLGVVLVADRVFGAALSEVGSNDGTGIVTPSGGEGSLRLFIPVVFGLGLLATGIISARRRNGDMRERGERTRQTIETVEPADAPSDETLKLKKRNRWLGWLSGFLAVAVIGLGTWLIIDQSSGPETALPSEVQTALDGYVAGWDAHDGAAALAFTTDDYTFVSNGTAFSRSQQAQSINFGAANGLRVEVLDGIFTGDGPYYLTQTERVHMTGAPAEGYPGVSVYTIVSVDGTWNVQQHQWTGDL